MAAPRRNRLEPGIYERIDANGQRLGREIQYKDADGRPRRRTVHGNMHAARDALAEARSKRVRREREPLDPRATFGAVCDAFEAAHVAGLRPNSRAVNRAALARLRSEFDSKRITQITRADIRRYVNELAAERKANTVRSDYSVLRAVFNFAASDLDIPVVFPRLKPNELPDPADDQREHRVLTGEELARVLEACDERSRLYFQTAAETGARASEVLGLTRQRIGDGTIGFAQQLGRDGTLRPLKSRRSARTIEVRRALTAELRLAGGERVFERLTLNVVGLAWRDAIERADIADPQPVIHELRHTHVSALIAAGWDVVEIASCVGDTIETVLRVYSHVRCQAPLGAAPCIA